MGFTWIKTPSEAFPPMAVAYTQAIFQSGRRIAYERAEDMENFAKANAPWQDVTGDARERLHATVEEAGPIATIVLAHGVFYGLYLETANQGRFSIIPQTIDVFGPIIMRDLQRLMNLGLAAR